MTGLQNKPKAIYTKATGHIDTDEFGDIVFQSVLHEGANPNATWIEIFKELNLHEAMELKIAEIDGNEHFQDLQLTSKDF